MASVQLPEEILRRIFHQTDVQSVFQSRAVCRSWRDAVDCLSEGDWKIICANDNLHMERFADYVTIQKKSGISWPETIRAANSWDKIDSKKLKISRLCDGIVHFQILSGGVIACMLNKTILSKESMHLRKAEESKYCDTILFYNSENFELIEEQHFDFHFFAPSYDENEHLQFFAVERTPDDKGDNDDFGFTIDCADRLCVIVKKTKQRYFVGYGEYYSGQKHSQLEATLTRNALYFKTRALDIPYLTDRIHCSKLNENDIIETNLIGTVNDGICENTKNNFIKLFFAKDNDLYFLTEQASVAIRIYKHQSPDFVCIFKADNLFLEESYSYFRGECEREFHWLARHCGRGPILECLFHNAAREDFDLEQNAFYTNGTVLVWYLEPDKTTTIYDMSDVTNYVEMLSHLWTEEDLYKITTYEPTESMMNVNDEVTKFDIIDTTSSHQIFTLYGRKLYVVHLPYGLPKTSSKRKIIRKRKAEETKQNVPKKLPKKKDISTNKNKGTIIAPCKHTYATRSSTKL